MMDHQINYIQQIYRIILALIALWFLNLFWPYISDVILMLVFAFLFTTLLLSGVDTFERKIGNRGLLLEALFLRSQYRLKNFPKESIKLQ